jgi:hypothetical protein
MMAAWYTIKEEEEDKEKGRKKWEGSTERKA